MSFENIAYAPRSPGRVFLLNEDDIVERLERLEDISGGSFAWSETAGLRQIIRIGNRSADLDQQYLHDALSNPHVREAA